ncbi:hypothetical protein DBR40_07190 [Pedobacter sp. KBW01]|uniref:hypothetical protein n=1 Tax=Pedobacter sp. KBW01 TaxID=2153364 RepID=UPI000F59097B|nr:hypothetical protein [Pedobacter sp. KBW01]RQO77752.1 hypothetical protein DBR40_07190 [Pedobacter sp. KBW01]
MNYIIKHTGDKPVDLKKVAEVIRAHQGDLIDGSAMPTMGLVKIAPEEIESLKQNLDEWQVFPEKSYQVPNTRKKTGGPFGGF